MTDPISTTLVAALQHRFHTLQLHQLHDDADTIADSATHSSTWALLVKHLAIATYPTAPPTGPAKCLAVVVDEAASLNFELPTVERLKATEDERDQLGERLRLALDDRQTLLATIRGLTLELYGVRGDLDLARAALRNTTRERDSLARRLGIRFQTIQAYRSALAELTDASRRLVEAIDQGAMDGPDFVKQVRAAITRAGQAHTAAEIIRLDEEWTPKLQAFADKILREKASSQRQGVGKERFIQMINEALAENARTEGGSVARVARPEVTDESGLATGGVVKAAAPTPTEEEVRHLAEVVARAYESGIRAGTWTLARVILAAGYRQAAEVARGVTRPSAPGHPPNCSCGECGYRRSMDTAPNRAGGDS